MNSYKIFTDSSCDYGVKTLEIKDVGLISYLVNVGRDPYEYLLDGREVDAAKFYELIKDAPNMPKTSMPSIETYVEAFEPYLQKGADILCLTLTKKFSNSFSAATQASERLQKKYPGARVVIFDTKSCTAIQGMILDDALTMRGKGFSIDEITAKLSVVAENQRAFITVDTLTFLQRGGRIGSVGAFAGNLLNIKPLISLDNGELHPIEKIRGRKKTIARIAELFCADINEKRERYNIVVLHTQSAPEAEELRTELIAQGYAIPRPIAEVGPIVGAHIGPTVVGAAYTLKHEYA